MNPEEDWASPTAAGESDGVDDTQRLGAPRNEAILIRSYDHQWAYDLDVEVVSGTGEQVFQRRYYLLPGHVESEPSVVRSGEFTVRVTLDNERERQLECRLGDSPEHTLVVEVGNGSLSLREGVNGGR